MKLSAIVSSIFLSFAVFAGQLHAEGFRVFLFDPNINKRLAEFQDSNTAATMPVLGKMPKKVTAIADLAANKANFVRFVLYWYNPKNNKKILMRNNLEKGAPWSLYTNNKNLYVGKTLANGKYDLSVTALKGTKKSNSIVAQRQITFTVGPFTVTPASSTTSSPGNVPASVGTPIPVVNPAPSGTSTLARGSLIKGITSLATEFSDRSLNGKLLRDDLGIESIRSWMTIDWANPPSSTDFDALRQIRAQGLQTVVCFTMHENPGADQIPSYNQAFNYFSSAAAAAGDAVDYWEIGNEPNLKGYFPNADLKVYMNSMLIPASKALHAKGQIVVGAPIAEFLDDTQTLVNLGVLNYVDVMSYHSYGYSLSEAVSRVKTVRGMIGNSKPLFITEWNIKNNQSTPGRAKDIVSAYNQIKGDVDGLWYYRSVIHGDMGIFSDAKGTKRFPAYCSVYAIYKGMSGIPSQCSFLGN